MSSFWNNLESFNVYSNESWGNNPVSLSSYEAGIPDLNTEEVVSAYHPCEDIELQDLNEAIPEYEYAGEPSYPVSLSSYPGEPCMLNKVIRTTNRVTRANLRTMIILLIRYFHLKLTTWYEFSFIFVFSGYIYII